MLVVLCEEQILSVQQICQGCLLADRTGLPRKRQGKPCCAHLLGKSNQSQPTTYECEMGFRLAEIE
jgi:hypothetical protein